MASAVVSLALQSSVSEYAVFYELWPQFAARGGERQQLGLEVELIGSHTSDVNHIDPACPMCSRLRSFTARCREAHNAPDNFRLASHPLQH